MKETNEGTARIINRSAPPRRKFSKVYYFLVLLLAAAALCAFAPQARADNWIDHADTEWYEKVMDGEWDGIGYRTFEISTAEELAGLAKLVNEGTYDFADAVIKLTADIDLSGRDWMPIGVVDRDTAVVTWSIPTVGIGLNPYRRNYSGKYFNGSFLGGGHKITGLKVDLDDSCVGLFSVLGIDETGSGKSGIAVSDLSVEGDVAGASFCGLIAGDSGGATIANCKVKGTVRGSELHVYNYPDPNNGPTSSTMRDPVYHTMGGVAGIGQAVNCVADVAVTGDFRLGGVVGSGTAYGCSASGEVISIVPLGKAYIFHESKDVEMKKWYFGPEDMEGPGDMQYNWHFTAPRIFFGDETFKSAFYGEAGGIAGRGIAVSCRSSVKVSADNLEAVGGVVGSSVTDVINCVYIGESVTGAHNVGGIVGTGRAANCYAKGVITATGSRFKSVVPTHAPNTFGSTLPDPYQEYNVYLGGIVGEVDNSGINANKAGIANCVSECELKFPADYDLVFYIGQIAGYANISRRSDYATDKYLEYVDDGAAFYNLAWTGEYPPFGIVEQNVTEHDQTVKYVYVTKHGDIPKLPPSYLADWRSSDPPALRVAPFVDGLYNKHNVRQKNDVGDLVAAVLPENGIVGMDSAKFNFVGYPKNDATANVAFITPDERTAGFAVKADGASIAVSGVQGSSKTASFYFGTVVKASDAGDPSQTVAEDYCANVGSAESRSVHYNGVHYVITPVINAENGQGIGFMGSVGSGTHKYGTYPTGMMLALWPASGEEPPQTSTVESVTLDRTEITLEPGDPVALNATVWPNSAPQTVKWSSSDEKVATVNSDGIVTPVAEGTATIRATSTEDESKYAECVVTVARIAAPEPTTPKIDENIKIPEEIDVTSPVETFTREEEAIEAISSDIMLEQSGDGSVYPAKEAAEAAVKAKLEEGETLSQSNRLPVFTVSTSSPTAAAAWIVQGPALLADKIEDVDIRKIISATESKKFAYKAADFTDGSFTILNEDGTQAAGAVDRAAQYQILLFIGDNGGYDLNKADGVIADPAVIVRTSRQSNPNPPAPPSGGGGGGCSAGWGALSLLAIVPLFARRKK